MLKFGQFLEVGVAGGYEWLEVLEVGCSDLPCNGE
jgi:hypothetical protein